MKIRTVSLLLASLVTLYAPCSFGGLAWVPDPGKGWLQLGYSQKMAHHSWSPSGEFRANKTTYQGERVYHYHDFRYTYLSGDVGIFRNFAASFLLTHLNGLEGPLQDLEVNSGLSDAWVGARYQVQKAPFPLTVGVSWRFPYFYDLPGDYDRYLYNEDGTERTESPEWRGILKHDVALQVSGGWTFLQSGWLGATTSYNFRTGAPADEILVDLEAGYPVGFLRSAVKGTLYGVFSMGNDSPRKGNDRFGSSPRNNFNSASMIRGGISWRVPLDHGSRFHCEVGYNQWLWGKSARVYMEPFLALSIAF